MVSTAITAMTNPDPLFFMTALSTFVSLYRPVATASLTTPSAPRLIILLSWMDARPIHIAKYVQTYQTLYPTSPILLMRCAAKHVFFPTLAARQARIAAGAVRASLGRVTGRSRPQVLVHVWSNGGSCMLAELRRAHGGNFPCHASVFDSAPGRTTLQRGMAAMTAGLTGAAYWVLLPVLLVAGVAYTLVCAVLGVRDVLDRLFDEHLKRDAGEEVRRTYVYSETDRMVDWKVVERHAELAQKRGLAVRRERFEGTAHVAHARGDEERYWRLVRETWEGRV